MTVADDVKAVIAQGLRISAEELNDARQLVELGAESFDVIEIVFALEEKFDIDITEAVTQTTSSIEKSQHQRELSPLMTVGDICRAVQELVEAKSSK